MLRQRPFYAVFTALSPCRIILSSLKFDLSRLQIRASDFGLAFWGGWGDDDDSVAQTLRTVSPEEPFYSVFCSVCSFCDDRMPSPRRHCPEKATIAQQKWTARSGTASYRWKGPRTTQKGRGGLTHKEQEPEPAQPGSSSTASNLSAALAEARIAPSSHAL